MTRFEMLLCTMLLPHLLCMQYAKRRAVAVEQATATVKAEVKRIKLDLRELTEQYDLLTHPERLRVDATRLRMRPITT